MKTSRLSAWDKACLRVLIHRHLRGKRDYLPNVLVRCRQLTKKYTAKAVKEACQELCKQCPNAQKDRIERIIYFVSMLNEQSYLLL